MEITVSQLVQSMPEDKMANMGAQGEHLAVSIEDRDVKLQELTDNPDLFHILMQAQRPGTGEFQTYLEHQHFSPNDPELNDKLELRVIKWCGLLWNMITIPISMKQLAWDTCEAVNMRFEVEGAIPHICDGDGWHVFPVSKDVGDRIVHLINASDSDVYKGPLGTKDAEIAERGRVRYFLKQKGLTDEELDQPMIMDIPVENEPDDPWEDKNE